MIRKTTARETESHFCLHIIHLLTETTMSRNILYRVLFKRGHLSWELYRFQFNTLSSMKECFTRVHRCDAYVMVNKRSTVNIGFDIEGQKRVILDRFKHMATSLFRVLKDILGKSCLHRCHNWLFWERWKLDHEKKYVQWLCIWEKTAC